MPERDALCGVIVRLLFPQMPAKPPQGGALVVEEGVGRIRVDDHFVLFAELVEPGVPLFDALDRDATVCLAIDAEERCGHGPQVVIRRLDTAAI